MSFVFQRKIQHGKLNLSYHLNAQTRNIGDFHRIVFSFILKLAEWVFGCNSQTTKTLTGSGFMTQNFERTIVKNNEKEKRRI